MMEPYVRPGSLITRQQLIVLVVAHVVGAVLVAVAAGGARSEDQLADQIGWVNLAIVGLLVAGAASAAALLTAHRLIRLRVQGALGSSAATRVRTAATHRPVSMPSSSAGTGFLWVPGTQRRHVATCEFVAGRQVEVLADSGGLDLLECEACLGAAAR